MNPVFVDKMLPNTADILPVIDGKQVVAEAVKNKVTWRRYENGEETVTDKNGNNVPWPV